MEYQDKKKKTWNGKKKLNNEAISMNAEYRIVSHLIVIINCMEYYSVQNISFFFFFQSSSFFLPFILFYLFIYSFFIFF